ncbi:WAP four-disulfide core domain protein 6B [Lamellibrachia satsuma]|nr:WAP four-disulfide core domain protein 6B [Lamellibrachia satsuma]
MPHKTFLAKLVESPVRVPGCIEQKGWCIRSIPHLDTPNVKCSPRQQCVRKVQFWLVPVCPEVGFCVDVCDLPKRTGHCLAYIPRWFYNKNTGQCVKFIYGGCGGNMNNFETAAACRRMCPCPRFTCDKTCEFCHELDKNGCRTCACRITPCAYTFCGQGTHCYPVPWGWAGCRRTATCIKAKPEKACLRQSSLMRYLIHVDEGEDDRLPRVFAPE